MDENQLKLLYLPRFGQEYHYFKPGMLPERDGEGLSKTSGSNERCTVNEAGTPMIYLCDDAGYYIS